MSPRGDSFLYKETSQNNSEFANNSVSFERTDFIQISTVNFYFNRFLADGVHKAGVYFRIPLLFGDNQWEAQNTIEKNTGCSATSEEWTLLKLDFTISNYGIRFFL